MENLGMMTLLSVHNRYLQSHSSFGANGEMHASNPQHNQEETWFLFEVDKSAHKYALANWRNSYYMNRTSGNANVHRVMVNSHDPVASAIWTLASGKPFGLPDSLAFQAYDGSWLMANPENQNAPGEPGEVYVERNAGPHADPKWQGWFKATTQTTPPTPGDNWPNTLLDWLRHAVSNKQLGVVIEDLVTALLTAGKVEAKP